MIQGCRNVKISGGPGMVLPLSGHLGGTGGMPPQKILKFEAVLGAFWGHLRQLCQLTTLHYTQSI